MKSGNNFMITNNYVKCEPDDNDIQNDAFKIVS